MAQRTVIQERRKQILDYITKNQKADLAELAAIFNSTQTTIRRDLIEIEKTNLIIRTHGGAIRNEQKKAVWNTSSLYSRLEKNKDKKTRIAGFAATLIKDNESVIIDGGSTTQLLAPFIKDDKNMLFVTNSPEIADILLENEENNVIQLGGELTRDTHLTIGPDAEEHLRRYYVDKCITSITAIDPEIGCYTAIPSEASFKKILIKHARETILLVDSSKFDRKAFCLAFDIEDVDIIVTDSDTPKESIEKLREKNIKVFVV